MTDFTSQSEGDPSLLAQEAFDCPNKLSISFPSKENGIIKAKNVHVLKHLSKLKYPAARGATVVKENT